MDFEEDIKNSVATLAQGGTLLYPTDTIWGLGCDATSAAAVERIFHIKQRPQEKSMIVLLAEPKDILQYVATPHPDIIDIVSQFDRPTTVIFQNAIDLAENLVNADGSIAIRIPADPFCKALLKRFRKPIVSTSANISGQPSPQTFAGVSNEIIQAADYTVRYRQDDTETRQPSRLVRLNDNGELEIIRA
ncbi:MAG: threonylcarbamoyl-AMP synthase [Flavipsychrobacter sp.]|nr:threonylcarbamoyl-AMP synthase [Flavipsychrobacter sp.]